MAGKRMHEYAVAYDVACDRERGRVDKLLLGYGLRVQRSVFECTLTRTGREHMIADLVSLGLETGYVYVYRLQYGARRVAIGNTPPDLDSGFAYVV